MHPALFHPRSSNKTGLSNFREFSKDHTTSKTTRKWCGMSIDMYGHDDPHSLKNATFVDSIRKSPKIKARYLIKYNEKNCHQSVISFSSHARYSA